MNQITIYTKDHCGYCVQAKQLLSSMGISFNEQKLERDFTRDQLVSWYPSARTYPVVVVDGFHIGGAAELSHMLTEARRQNQLTMLNEVRT